MIILGLGMCWVLAGSLTKRWIASAIFFLAVAIVTVVVILAVTASQPTH